VTAPRSDVAFTPTVKAIQAARGSRDAYAKMEARGGFHDCVTDELAAFFAGVDTAFLATANVGGQPYVQHRGGPKGFIRVIDDHTIGFADFAGNRQYITTGNLAENAKAFLFLMDYARCQRVKLWGHARVVDDDPDLVAQLMPDGYAARGEQAILFKIEAWDVNCPRHIPRKLDAADVTDAIARLQTRIAVLEAENSALRTRLGE
jgi:uncharacterized protein